MHSLFYFECVYLHYLVSISISRHVIALRNNECKRVVLQSQITGGEMAQVKSKAAQCLFFNMYNAFTVLL